jgi:hypothetical protein
VEEGRWPSVRVCGSCDLSDACSHAPHPSGRSGKKTCQGEENSDNGECEMSQMHQ